MDRIRVVPIEAVQADSPAVNGRGTRGEGAGALRRGRGRGGISKPSIRLTSSVSRLKTFFHRFKTSRRYHPLVLWVGTNPEPVHTVLVLRVMINESQHAISFVNPG